jgi:hypothetical protein
MTEPVQAGERRSRRDRRGSGEAGRRGATRSPHKQVLLTLLRDAAAVVVLVAAIAWGVMHVRPIFAGSPKVVQSIAERVPITRPAPPVDPLTSSPEFEEDRRAFADDLVRTGRMDPGRADTIAYYAVREAHRRGIPPAVIFGVMLTENALFVSNAMSNVGAVGLMQVYPKVWLKELGDRFGTDLASDSTNLKYGIYILSEYIKPKRGATEVTPSDVSKGLLKYNGCVRGTNTPHCKNYPTKVKGFVEKQAEALCGDKAFYDCIAKPFMAGLLGKSDPTN